MSAFLPTIPEGVETRFHVLVDRLSKRFKGRSATRRVQDAYRAEMTALVSDYYKQGGYLLDFRDETPIFDVDQVHVAVDFKDHALSATIVRQKGRLS